MKAIRMATMGALLAMASATTAAAQVRVGVGVGVRTPSARVQVMFGTPVYYYYQPVVAYAPYPVTYEEVYLEPWPVWPVGYWEYVRLHDPWEYQRYQSWIVFQNDYRDAWARHDWVRFRELRRERWDYRNDLYRADRDFRGWQEQQRWRGGRRTILGSMGRDRGDRGWRDDRGRSDDRSWRDDNRGRERGRHGHDRDDDDRDH